MDSSHEFDVESYSASDDSSMKRLRVAANLSFLFYEQESLLDRYRSAAKSGFRFVECANPYETPALHIKHLLDQTELKQVLINAPVGKFPGGERGIACLPDRTADFKSSVLKAIEYAKILECPRIHVMAGIIPDNVDEASLDSIYLENIKYAATEMQKENLTALIEPINRYSFPRYYLSSFAKAQQFIRGLSLPNLKLQLDIFHLQQVEGSLTHWIKELFPLIGHIQVAQVPDRHEPNSAGEINYRYVLKLLKELNYDGLIGLEYTPAGKTTDSFEWIGPYGCEI